MKKEFNVSACELGQQDLWQRSLLGFAQIGSSRDAVHGALNRIAERFAGDRQVELLDHSIELL